MPTFTRTCGGASDEAVVAFERRNDLVLPDAPLPWTTANKLSLRFTCDVIVQESDLSVVSAVPGLTYGLARPPPPTAHASRRVPAVRLRPARHAGAVPGMRGGCCGL